MNTILKEIILSAIITIVLGYIGNVVNATSNLPLEELYKATSLVEEITLVYNNVIAHPFLNILCFVPIFALVYLILLEIKEERR